MAVEKSSDNSTGKLLLSGHNINRTLYPQRSKAAPEISAPSALIHNFIFNRHTYPLSTHSQGGKRTSRFEGQPGSSSIVSEADVEMFSLVFRSFVRVPSTTAFRMCSNRFLGSIDCSRPPSFSHPIVARD